MNIFHLALGGCLTAPPIEYGLTEDTGGHIAYVLGAATAQAAREDVTSVTILTRAFHDSALGSDYARLLQPVRPGLVIRRLRTDNSAYLAKEALAAELPALTQAFLNLLEQIPVRPDVIHAHFSDAAVLAAAARVRFGIPFIYTPHSLGIDKLEHLTTQAPPLLLARISQERTALQTADAVVVSSRDEAERQVAAYGLEIEGNVHRIWPGVDIEGKAKTAVKALPSVVERCLRDPERPMILVIARPVARKNLQKMANLFATSPLLQAKANLVILAGQHKPGVQEEDETANVWAELNAILSAPHLKGLVALPATHTPSDVTSLYAMARRTRGVFVNLALHEPFGLTLLEAARHGLPVVVGDRGGPVDILAHTGHGITVDPTDSHAIMAALRKMLTVPAVWDRHAQAARRHIGAFDWTAWANHVDAICKDMVTRTGVNQRPSFILGCDIDNTLTGCATGAAQFARWHSSRTGLFIVATGRSIVEARRVLRAWSLPEPDVFITAVGTEIHQRDGNGRWTLNKDYAALMDSSWSSAAVRDCIMSAGLTWQPAIEQRRWKFGCTGTAQEAERLRHVLRAAGLKTRVIVSHGRLIDVMPVSGGKGAALLFLAQHFGLTASDVIAAGDSGNDVDMLMTCGRGIVVGNALPEIAELRRHPHLYHASAPYAGGVMEGLNAFGIKGTAAEYRSHLPEQSSGRRAAS